MGCCTSKNTEEVSRKISVLGDNRTGKTCLIQRFLKDEFEEDTPEVYIASSLQVEEETVQLKNGQKVHLHIYDLGGQESFKHLRKLNYPRSDAAIICFSIADKGSLKNVQDYWVSEMRRVCPDIPMILVGLKRDLRDDATKIDEFVREGQGHNMAKKHKLAAYVECSSMSGDNVQQVFQTIARVAAKKKNTRKVEDAEFSKT